MSVGSKTYIDSEKSELTFVNNNSIKYMDTVHMQNAHE